MTIKQFIEKAIEGGWDAGIPKGDTLSAIYLNPENDACKAIFLEPKAWQAVGKVEDGEFDFEKPVCPLHGDEDLDPGGITHEGEGEAYCNLCPSTDSDGREAPDYIPLWQYKMHRFIDALAEGKTIEEFLKTL